MCAVLILLEICTGVLLGVGVTALAATWGVSNDK